MEFGRRFVFLVFSLLFAFFVNTKDEFYDFKKIKFNTIFNEVKKDVIVPSYIDEKRTQYDNQDIVGHLYIESIDIDVPLVQYSDNEFYLNHDVYRNKNNIGSIFLDYRNNIDLDRKLLIFGHNSRTIQTEFKKMENFLLPSFFNDIDNRKLVLETINKVSVYEIDSVIIITTDFQHMILSFTRDEWKKHINWINNSSIYEEQLFTDTDDILIMQTCYYEPKDSYLLVVAKKIKEEFY